MLKDIKVALIYGGLSSEREISIKSGKAVEKAFKTLGINYKVFDPLEGRVFVEKLIKYNPDIAFLALHGKWGEDGTVQGLLEFLNIPYTGSSQKASAITMDKDFTKRILSSHNIPVPEGIVIKDDKDIDLRKLSFPVVVKPATEGSSVGVSIVKNEKELKNAVIQALKLDSKVLVEQYIKGREITVGVLDGMPLEIVEIIVKDGFYDYENKYFSGKTEYIYPAKIEKSLYSYIQQLAEKSCKLLEVKGAARVDFILSEDNIPYLLEINIIPGLTDQSLLPKSAQAAGITFEDLIERMVLGALYGKKTQKTEKN